MKEKLPELQVQMFGKFILTYEDRAIPLGRNSATKALQLLLILLYSGEQGIARDELLERLYGDVDSDRPVRNLYSCVRYLKDILAETPLPAHDYIVLKKGVYRWDAPMKTTIDAKCFMQMTKGQTVESREDVERLKEACRIYRRGFLPDFCDQEWVLLEGIRLKRYYTDAVEQVCAWLMQEDEFEEAYQMADQACTIYPFDDWQVIKMRCLIAMGRAKEAVAEYYATEELLRKEMDVDPSEKMQELLRLAKRSKGDWAEHRFAEAIEQLKEDGKDTDIVYYCDLPGFRDTYRMIARRIEYNGKSASLMLLSLGSDAGTADAEAQKKAVKAGADVTARSNANMSAVVRSIASKETSVAGVAQIEDALLDIPYEENTKQTESVESTPISLKKRMRLLKQAIWQSLRRTDVFTQCSATQYLVLLYGVGAKDGKNIAGRIRSRFMKSWQGADCLTISVAPVEPAGASPEPQEYKRNDDVK